MINSNKMTIEKFDFRRILDLDIFSKRKESGNSMPLNSRTPSTISKK